MAAKEPASIEEITPEYLSTIAQKALGDDSVEVTSFELVHDPFEFPRFGEKQFYEIPYHYTSKKGDGDSHIILRVMPEMDAVMMLTGDTQHRELRAFKDGLMAQIPDTFEIPYVDVILDDDRKQYWAWLRDVRPEMQALGMHAKCPEDVVRTILSHLAAFHAKFWEDHNAIDRPYLMSLQRPIDYFYRTITDIIDGMKDPSPNSVYVVERWPWLAEGVPNLLAELPRDIATVVERLYREPQPLLDAIAPMPETLCHYDFDNRNLGMSKFPDGRPRTVVIDWEILGRGLSASDVLRLMFYQQPDDLDAMLDYYMDELERYLGKNIDRQLWKRGYDLGVIVEFQIRGVIFPAMVAAPSAPIPDDQRPAMRERSLADIGYIASVVERVGL
jgi:Phosphotransferase enzyme family